MPRRKRPAGRPPLPKGEVRRFRVVVMLNRSEYRRLRAATTGQPLGIGARELLLAALGEGTR